MIEDVNGNISDHLTEDLLREAYEGLPGELDYSCRRLRRAYVYADTAPLHGGFPRFSELFGFLKGSRRNGRYLPRVKKVGVKTKKQG